MPKTNKYGAGEVAVMLYLRSFNRFILISLALLGLSVSSANAATYVLAEAFGSELQGANGVIVNGLSYNVEFVDGSCISLFDECNDVSDFTFNTAADADAASQALLDQVFNLFDIYDTTPSLMRGIFNNYGFVWTPYGMSGSNAVRVDSIVNYGGNTTDTNSCSIGACSLAITNDLSSGFDTYAKWTQVSAVPIPAAVWLFGTGILGLIGFSKRKAATLKAA
jgi:hypothetical protein